MLASGGILPAKPQPRPSLLSVNTDPGDSALLSGCTAVLRLLGLMSRVALMLEEGVAGADMA